MIIAIISHTNQEAGIELGLGNVSEEESQFECGVERENVVGMGLVQEQERVDELELEREYVKGLVVQMVEKQNDGVRMLCDCGNVACGLEKER